MERNSNWGKRAGTEENEENEELKKRGKPTMRLSKGKEAHDEVLERKIKFTKMHEV